jgi:hypothetical protein
MKLYAEVSDEDLLFKLIHQLGATFFRTIDQEKDIIEIVYLSGEKYAYYKGTVSEEHWKLLNAVGYPVDEIEINEAEKEVKIIQR